MNRTAKELLNEYKELRMELSEHNRMVIDCLISHLKNGKGVTMIDKRQFTGWLKSHNICYFQIASTCHVTEEQALRWICPNTHEHIPELELKVLWNHFELGLKLEPACIE